MALDADGLQIGEVAEAAGVTIRALRHYEAIGLLAPAGRTVAGYRLYDAGAVERIYRICLLRRLGMSLAEISRALDDDEWTMTSALNAHLDDVEQRLAAAHRLRTGLVQLLAATAVDSETSDPLMEVLTNMATLDNPLEARIQILVYADIEAAMTFLVEVFGLGPGELSRNGQGAAVHGTVDAGDGVIWLHPESPEFGLASPRSLGSATAMMAVMVDDVDSHHERAKARGAEVVYPPVDQPYGYREYGARDAEGGLWSFMKALGDQEST